MASWPRGLGRGASAGVFRKSCEVSLRLLRAHRDLLCNVLETFIHDPLLEWTASRKEGGKVRLVGSGARLVRIVLAEGVEGAGAVGGGRGRPSRAPVTLPARRRWAARSCVP